jgi:hypothetical protein
MSFFDDTFHPEPADEPEPPDFAPPPWMGAPSNVIPGVAPVELLIGRTPNAAVAVGGMRVYPAGITFTLQVRTNGLSHADEQRVWAGLTGHRWDDDPEAPPDPGQLRWGVLFADGRKVTTLDEHWGSEGEPEQPILESGSGGGSPGHYDSEYWPWPLPPPGPLVFVCEWAAVGIAETRTEIDAGPILAAAERAVTLWPDQRPPWNVAVSRIAGRGPVPGVSSGRDPDIREGSDTD